MREIKFRAWDGDRMIEWHQIQLYRWIQFASLKNIMQYTGLKDKNGTEIYECDLIMGQVYWMRGDGYKSKKYPDVINIICEIQYKHGSFTHPKIIKPIDKHREAYDNVNYRGIGYFLNPLSNGSRAYNTETQKFDIEGDDQTCLGIEVIGNIYQNKELLTKTQIQ